MEFNRNQYFMGGVLLLLVGIQFRLLDSFTLNEKTTKFLAARMQDSGQTNAMTAFMPAEATVGRKVVRPPQWLGWALMSIGSVLVLHSLAMKKPGG